MAPLLGRKPFPLLGARAEEPRAGDQMYVIEHTGEAFGSRDEYEERLKKYGERIWTCKSTGSIQLTHKEAWDEEQEVTELLKEEYPVWFEKPVLEMVHHNTVSLDKLMDQAWVEILTKYAVEEECDFLVGKDKTLRVRVVKVHPLEKPQENAVEKKLEGAYDTPSSDKENTSQENQKEDLQPTEEHSSRGVLSERARRSPRKLPTTAKEEKKKWVMPKFLPHKYDVKLLDEDKVISKVPTESLLRTERPPNKEILRYFIRHTSLRLGTGENAPWLVEDELVRKYSLPSKFSDFLLDPHKYFAENPSMKRRSLKSPDARPSKKLKAAAVEGHLVSEKGKKVKQKAPLGAPSSPTLWAHVQMKKLNESPLKVKNSGIPKKPSSSREAGVTLLMPSIRKDGKLGRKRDGTNWNEAKKSRRSGGKSENLQNANKEDGKVMKSPKMKQMTLLDVTKSKSSGSPKKRARSAGPSSQKLRKPLPPMALHLLHYYKDNKGKEDKKSALSSLLSKAAKVLTAEDRSRLPEELRQLVQKRWELLEHKRRWAAMSEEEKQEELQRRREDLKEKLRQRAKERRKKEMMVRQEQQRRYEDQDLQGKSLPPLKLVHVPEGIPNSLFGDIAMVAEFLSCYAGLLMPDDQYTASGLAEALAAQSAGFLYLNRVLVVLLQTLLHDELVEGYRELDTPLSEIPLTLHSASELLRLCLQPRNTHADASASGESTGGSWDDTVRAELLERLETSEVFELSPQEKVCLLVALCHRILMTYSLEDHVEAVQQRSAELWKERLAMLKQLNERKRAEKQRRKEALEAQGPPVGWQKLEGGGSKEVAPPPPAGPEPDDMLSTVKSRRLHAIQAKKDKEECEKVNKERMEKEAEEERARKQKAAAERTFHEAIRKAKRVLRHLPLGTDRNHSRYWLFSDVVPGLYVEKGWVHDSIGYSFSPSPEEVVDEVDSEGEEARRDRTAAQPTSSLTPPTQGCPPVPAAEKRQDGGICNPVVGCAGQGTPAAPPASVEKSVPKGGQNLWFVCDTAHELEELMESLHPQGVRESELRSRLQYRYEDILHSISMAHKSNPGPKTSDGHQELLSYLCSDIVEMASRLQKGGLGYIDDTGKFEQKVRSLENIRDFGECIITLQENVIKKFLQGFMAPKQKNKQLQGMEEGNWAEELDEAKRLAEEARVASAVERWKSAIREAHTFSRMHVLLGMLDSCVKWDMSAENARCKVCCKKGEDDKLILCDECNKAFHLFCLRPALYCIPKGEWLCPGCQPAVARRYSRARNFNEETEEEDDFEEEEEAVEEEEDFACTGHSLRPRRAAKTKRSSSRNKSVETEKVPPSGAADSGDTVPRSSRTGELDKCREILQKLIQYRYSWPFREPVSCEEAEDYLDIISQPMDLHTMEHKLSEGRYRHTADFLDDMKLVFSNAERYNGPSSVVLSCAAKTEHSFAELLHKWLPGLSYLRCRPENRQEVGHGSGRSNQSRAELCTQEGGVSLRRSTRRTCTRRDYCEWNSEEDEDTGARHRSTR